MKTTILSTDGICLVEMLIATVAGAVVLSAALQSLDHFERRLWSQIERIDREQQMRVGLKILADEIRIAGTGGKPWDPPLMTADSQEMEFLANLEGLATSLREPVADNATQLVVLEGENWPKGKRIVVCDLERCQQGRLSREGQEHSLTLVEPLHEWFQAGDSVIVSNTVRYYMSKDRWGNPALMRAVDGGANPLISHVTWLQFRYLDRSGQPTSDVSRVARVCIELGVSGQPRIAREVALRARS